MAMGDIYGVTLLLALIFCMFVAPPILAARKGYNPALWIFACGILGLLILAYLPFANTPDLWESEREERLKRGNTIGAILTAVCISFSILRSINF